MNNMMHLKSWIVHLCELITGVRGWFMLEYCEKVFIDVLTWNKYCKIMQRWFCKVALLIAQGGKGGNVWGGKR